MPAFIDEPPSHSPSSTSASAAKNHASKAEKWAGRLIVTVAQVRWSSTLFKAKGNYFRCDGFFLIGNFVL